MRRCWPNAGLSRRCGVLGRVRSIDREGAQAAAAITALSPLGAGIWLTTISSGEKLGPSIRGGQDDGSHGGDAVTGLSGDDTIRQARAAHHRDSYFMASKMTQASPCKAVKQLVALGFVTVEADKRPNTFTLCDKWQSIDADEAKRRMALARQPKPQRPSSKPPKPVKPEPKPMTVAPRIMRRAPSLPTMPWMDDGR